MSTLEKLIEIVGNQADTINNLNKSIGHLTEAITDLTKRVKDLEKKNQKQSVVIESLPNTKCEYCGMTDGIHILGCSFMKKFR